MLEEAEKLAIPEILAWVKLRIDGENIRSLVRLKRFGFDSARAASFLHEGGNIDLNTLAPMIAEPFETWGRMIDYSDLAGTLRFRRCRRVVRRRYYDLEKALDDYYLSSISGSRYSPNAPGNVITYLWAKELEVKNIRMIVVSKSTGKDSDQVRRLLRNVCA